MPKAGAAHSRRTSRHQAAVAADQAAEGPKKRRALANPAGTNKEVTHGVKSKFGERNRLLIQARLHRRSGHGDEFIAKAAAIAPLSPRELKRTA